MMQRLIFLSSVSMLLATGCGTKPAATPVPPVPLPDLTGNWQIQSGPYATTPVALGVIMLGALQNTGAQVTGTFRFTNLAQPLTSGCALNQVITVTGTINATGDLTLTSAPLPDGTTLTVQLVVASAPGSSATGTLAVSGKNCAVAATPAIALRFPPVTGTFAGALTPGTVVTQSTINPAGTASLAISQSSMPAADGQFPVTGTLTYTFGTCTGSTALTGTVSGASLTLQYEPPLVTLGSLSSTVALLGYLANNSSQIALASLLFTSFPCSTSTPPGSAIYSGTLARQ